MKPRGPADARAPRAGTRTDGGRGSTRVARLFAVADDPGARRHGPSADVAYRRTT